LTHDEIRLAVPPGHEWAHIGHLADTAGAAWIVEPYGAASRHFAEQACRQAGFEPDVRFETADLTAQIGLIESGNAVALIPDLMWARRAPSVRLIRLEGAPHRTVFTAARRSMAQRPSILACRDALAGAVANLSHSTSASHPRNS
jgi:DNA-binding transcriptional LysR family regulator